MSQAESAQQEIQEISSFIATAKQQLESGEDVDLKPLEKKVETLCESVTQLEDAQQQDLKVSMLALVDDFNQLQKSLEGYRDQLKSELQKKNDHKQAAQAYKPPSGGDS